jgi:hypothetical protein
MLVDWEHGSWADVPGTDIRLVVCPEPKGWKFAAFELSTGICLASMWADGEEDARARARLWASDFSSDADFLEWRTGMCNAPTL